ncbi:MAG: hypothetical protein Q8Q39_04870 [bacterium]|nr:hypothetical protein [bacterium]
MHPILKKSFIAFFVVGLSVLFWLFVHTIFFQDPNTVEKNFWSLQNISIFSALLTLYATALAMAAFLLTERAWGQGVLLLGVLPIFLAAPMKGYELMGAFVALWAVGFFVREWIAKETRSRIDVAADRSVGPNLPWLMTAISLAVTVAFYISPAIGQLQGIQIPREVFQRFVAPLENLFKEQAQATVQSFITDAASPQGAKPLDMPRPLTPDEAEMLRRATTKIPLMTGGGDTGGTRSPYSEFSEALYRMVNSRIANIGSFGADTRELIAFSLSAALFASIRILTIPVGWLVMIFSMIIFNVLTYVGFVKIGTVQVDKETIEL